MGGANWLRPPEMRTIARWIAEALEHRNDPGKLKRIRKQVEALAEDFPLYAWHRPAPAHHG